VLAYFSEAGGEGGKIGRKRSPETMTAAERTVYAANASKAAAAARQAKGKRKRIEGQA